MHQWISSSTVFFMTLQKSISHRNSKGANIQQLNSYNSNIRGIRPEAKYNLDDLNSIQLNYGPVLPLNSRVQVWVQKKPEYGSDRLIKTLTNHWHRSLESQQYKISLNIFFSILVQMNSEVIDTKSTTVFMGSSVDELLCSPGCYFGVMVKYSAPL